MTRLRRRRSSSEEGLGLVELMISILLIGLILMGLATSLITSLRSIRVAEKTSLASALHQEILESELAREWDLIGIWTGDPDYVATVDQDGQTYDTAGRADELGLPPRKRTITRENVEFDVTLDVYWVDTNGDGVEEAKRLRTTIEWADGDRTSSSQFHAMRLPYAADFEDPFEILLFTASPNVMDLEDDGDTEDDIDLTVNLSSPGLRPTVSYTRADGSTGYADDWTSNADGTSWTGEIDEDSGPFYPGDQQLRLSVDSVATPTQTREAGFTVTFTGSVSGGDFSISQFTVNPTTAEVNNKRELCPTRFTIRVVGFTPADTVEVIYEYWTATSQSSSSNNATFDKNESNSIQATYIRTETSDSSNVAVFELDHGTVSHEYFVEGESITLTAKATRADTNYSKTLTRELSFVSTGTGSC